VGVAPQTMRRASFAAAIDHAAGRDGIIRPMRCPIHISHPLDAVFRRGRTACG